MRLAKRVSVRNTLTLTMRPLLALLLVPFSHSRPHWHSCVNAAYGELVLISVSGILSKNTVSSTGRAFAPRRRKMMG